MRVSDVARIYLAARHQDFARATRREVRFVLGDFARRTGDPLARTLRPRHIAAWLAGMELAPATVRNRLSIVRVFCLWCVANGHLKADPTLSIQGPRQPVALPRELTTEEVTRLLAVVPDRRGELMVMLGLVEGMRRSEIAGQLRENLDLTGKMMLVHGKGNKERWLPICDDTLELIEGYQREVPGGTGPLLRSTVHPHRGLTPIYVSALMSRWMLEAGVKSHAYDGKSMHALRHTFAGAMLDEGADIRVLQDALGHTNLSATFIYTRRRRADGPLREAMGRRSYR